MKPQNKAKHYKGIKNGSCLVILRDGLGKRLGHLIEQRTQANVCSFITPGAPFDQVTEEIKVLTRELKMEDHLPVVAGTNNLESTSIKKLDEMNKLINGAKHTILILACTNVT